jgi:hypothetical protein
MSDEQLTPIPPSFLVLYTGARGRLLEPADQVRARYELCEDLAQQVLPAAQALQHDDGLAEDDVLERMQMALSNPASGLRDGEPQWVVTRLAELARWTLPAPPAP